MKNLHKQINADTAGPEHPAPPTSVDLVAIESLAAPQQPDSREAQFVRSMRLSRMILPVLLGLLAVAYLFWSQFDIEKFREIRWTTAAFGWIALAFLLLIIRHLFYALRLFAITGGSFSFRKCIQLMVLWEFSSALTPTNKGGPAVMLFVLTKEKLSAGRTVTAVFYAMLADTGFFALMLPLMLFIYGPSMLFPGVTNFKESGFAGGTFLVTYSMMATYFVTLVFFMFVRPRYAAQFLQWLSKRFFLKRWSEKIAQTGHDFLLAAAEMRRQPARVHLSVVAGTVGAWFCKFAMINCLMIAVVPTIPLDGSTQAFIYARLVAMFIIMAFSPTPGGAGLAEIALSNFIADYVPTGIGLVVALLWRGMAYYGYLLVGALIVPGWIASRLRTQGAVISR